MRCLFKFEHAINVQIESSDVTLSVTNTLKKMRLIRHYPKKGLPRKGGSMIFTIIEDEKTAE
jgi:hypothetical protein